MCCIITDHHDVNMLKLAISALYKDSLQLNIRHLLIYATHALQQLVLSLMACADAALEAVAHVRDVHSDIIWQGILGAVQVKIDMAFHIVADCLCHVIYKIGIIASLRSSC